MPSRCPIIRKLCTEQFGDWVKRSIPEKLNTAKKRTTTVNLLNLASGVGHYQKIPHTEQTESHYSTTDNLLSPVIPEKLLDELNYIQICI